MDFVWGMKLLQDQVMRRLPACAFGDHFGSAFTAPYCPVHLQFHQRSTLTALLLFSLAPLPRHQTMAHNALEIVEGPALTSPRCSLPRPPPAFSPKTDPHCPAVLFPLPAYQTMTHNALEDVEEELFENGRWRWTWGLNFLPSDTVAQWSVRRAPTHRKQSVLEKVTHAFTRRSSVGAAAAAAHTEAQLQEQQWQQQQYQYQQQLAHAQVSRVWGGG